MIHESGYFGLFYFKNKSNCWPFILKKNGGVRGNLKKKPHCSDYYNKTV